MTEQRPFHGAVPDPGSLADRRAQAEHEQEQRRQERQQQIALLTSPLSTPEERIRLWEKLHALNLPRSPTHKLLRIIADQTELSLEQVLDVQSRSFAPRSPQGPAT
jgi:DNA topoisomerase VI subunit B